VIEQVHAQINAQLKELEAELNGKESTRKWSLSLDAPDGIFDEGKDLGPKNWMLNLNIRFGDGS
jgi:hypothetical protein